MTVSILLTDDSGDKVDLRPAHCLLFIFTEDFDQIIDRALKTGVEKVMFSTLIQVGWLYGLIHW